MRLARYLFISIATLLLPQAALAQQAGAAADKGEEAAKAECKAKSDPSILVNYWKTAAVVRSPAGAAPADPAALAELENRAKRICVTQGGGNSRSYTITGNAGPMKVTGTACSLAKPFTVKAGESGEFNHAAMRLARYSSSQPAVLRRRRMESLPGALRVRL